MLEEEVLQQKLEVLDQLQADCTHCGLCSEACITFQSSGWEQESPRGRIRLARELMNGNIDPNAPILDTFDSCLGCHACESICPHQVKYGLLRHTVQEVRSFFRLDTRDLVSQKIYKQWIRFAYRLGLVFWRSYLWKLKPPAILKEFVFRKDKRVSKNEKGKKKAQFVLAVGCLQNMIQSEVIEHVIELFNKLDVQLEVDTQQPCCGAIFDRIVDGKESLHYHQEAKMAKKYQQQRIQDFKNWMTRPTCFLSEGCACMVRNFVVDSKQLDHIIDIYMLLSKVLKEQKKKLRWNGTSNVYFHSYCRSTGSMREEIQRLIKRTEGLNIQPNKNLNMCCGGYGYEAIWHPVQSKQWVSVTSEYLQTDDIVVVTSLECYMQFKKHQQQSLSILHPLELFNMCEIVDG